MLFEGIILLLIFFVLYCEFVNFNYNVNIMFFYIFIDVLYYLWDKKKVIDINFD